MFKVLKGARVLVDCNDSTKLAIDLGNGCEPVMLGGGGGGLSIIKAHSDHRLEINGEMCPITGIKVSGEDFWEIYSDVWLARVKEAMSVGAIIFTVRVDDLGSHMHHLETDDYCYDGDLVWVTGELRVRPEQ